MQMHQGAALPWPDEEDVIVIRKLVPILAVPGLSIGLVAAAEAVTPLADIDRLAWMAGSWRSVGDGTLRARIEGKVAGEDRVQEWRYETSP